MTEQFLHHLDISARARSKVEYVWRNVCHPNRPLIPMLIATGRMIFRMIGCPQYGRRPPEFALANTQSPSASSGIVHAILQSFG